MLQEKWETILANIKNNFKVEEYDKVEYDEFGGTIIEYVVFESNLGKIKLEFTSKPVVINKKTHYSKRAGSDVLVDYVYSKTDRTNHMNAYKLNDIEDEWIKIDPKNFKK